MLRADVNKRLTLDSAELSKTPWVFFTAIPLPYELFRRTRWMLWAAI